MLKRKIAALLLLASLLCGMIAVLAGCDEETKGGTGAPVPEYATFDELSGKTVASLTGSIYDNIAKEKLPDAKTVAYETFADQIAALKAGKVDAVISEGPTAMELAREDSSVVLLDEFLCPCEYAAAFAENERGHAFCAELNAYLADVKKGTMLDEVYEIWFGEDTGLREMDDYTKYPATNGTLRLITDASFSPMVYMQGNRPVGYELDIIARFCKEKGYALSVKNSKTSTLFADLEAGNSDVVVGTVIVTEERKASMQLSDPYLETGVALIVRNENAGKTDLFAEIAKEFEATFIREDRWQLFLAGTGTTLLITLLSLLFGSLLGFLVYFIFRKNNAVFNKLTQICMFLVQAMPAVVFLMILYYIILAKTPLNEIGIAVTGFSITFACSVFGMLQMGIGAVPAGQTEAALALGFTDTQTFFKILLPQAAKHFLPPLCGEIVNHIKATAIVGYIAVTDLTRVSETIRSRTLHAFFPLIVTALIYMALEAVLSFAVRFIGKKTVFKQRGRREILKGIQTNED